jgi:hypothetical protein
MTAALLRLNLLLSLSKLIMHLLAPTFHLTG